MQEFKVGDYIDKGNANYFWKFEYPCDYCEEFITIYAAIVKGQLVGYYTNVDRLDMNSMENIEENYQRNLEYKAMCESGYGYDKCLYDKENLFDVGDVIWVLERDWIVEEIFEEHLIEHKDVRVASFHKCLFRNNRVYKVYDKDGNKRLIVTREFSPTHIVGLIDCDNDYNDYVEQIGTELRKRVYTNLV